jgi:hypothetical protein
MCEPERGGWGVGAAVKAVGGVLAVALAATVAVRLLPALPVLLGWVLSIAAGAGVLAAVAVWGLHARYMVVHCEAGQEIQRELQVTAEPVTLAARTYRQLPVAARRVVPGVVLDREEVWR